MFLLYLVLLAGVIYFAMGEDTPEDKACNARRAARRRREELQQLTSLPLLTRTSHLPLNRPQPIMRTPTILTRPAYLPIRPPNDRYNPYARRKAPERRKK